MFIVFLGFSAFFGILAVCFFDYQAGLRGLCFGAASLMLGMTLMGYAVLGLSVLTGNVVWANLIVSALAVLIIFLARRWIWTIISSGDFLARWRVSRPFYSAVMIGLGLTLFFVVSFQSMLWDNQGFPYSILKGWGDGAYHLSMVQRFIKAQPFALEQPVLANRVLTYPFLVNFLTALLAKLGLPLPVAWHLPVFVYGLAMLCLAWEWARVFLRQKNLSYLFIFLLLCGAGLGFVWLAKNIIQDAGIAGLGRSLWDNLVNPVFEYSHLDSRTGGKPIQGIFPANITWVVPLISFFSHQRSFMLGAALGFFLLWGLGSYSQDNNPRKWFRWLALLAFLPLVHLHTFIALVIWVGFWLGAQAAKFNLWQEKDLWKWLGITFLATLPWLVWLVLGVLADAGAQPFFLRPWLGWTMCPHRISWFWCDPGVGDATHNILWFWLKNFGLVFLGWLAGLILMALDRRALENCRYLIIPSLALFIIPNLVLFQPWEFDNNKVFFWWWVIACLFSLVFFRELGRLFPARQYLVRALLLVFCFGALASGGFDVMQRLRQGLAIIPNQKSFSYYGQYGLAAGQMVEKQTLAPDIILTSNAPNNPAVLLAGRKLYLGYLGWLWAQGKGEIIAERKKTVIDFLATGDPGGLCREGVAYWLVDEQFFSDYPAAATDLVWQNTKFIEAVSQGSSRTELRKILCPINP